MKSILTLIFISTISIISGQNIEPYTCLDSSIYKREFTITRNYEYDDSETDFSFFDKSLTWNLYQTISINNFDEEIKNKVFNFIKENTGQWALDRINIIEINKTYIDSIMKYFPTIAQHEQLEVKYYLKCKINIEPNVHYYFNIALNQMDSILTPPPFYFQNMNLKPLTICNAYAIIKNKFANQLSSRIEDIQIYSNKLTKKSYWYFSIADKVKPEKRKPNESYSYKTTQFLVDIQTGECILKSNKLKVIDID